MSRDPSFRRVPDELYLGSGYGNVRLDSSQFCQAIFVDRERQKIYETGTFKEKRTLLVLTSGKRGVLAVLNYFDQTVTLTISHPTPYWLLAIFLLTQGTMNDVQGIQHKIQGFYVSRNYDLHPISIRVHSTQSSPHEFVTIL